MAEIEFRVATEFNVVKVRISEETKSRIESLRTAGCCLGCERKLLNERVRRGLCDTCYSGMRNAVHKLRVTERDLMKEGRLLPASSGGRKPVNAFTASINNRTDIAKQANS